MSKKDKDNIKNLFSSKLENYQPEVPNMVWERLDRDLAMLNAPSRSSKVIVMKRVSALVACAAAIALLVLFIVPNDDKRTETLLSDKTTEISKIAEDKPIKESTVLPLETTEDVINSTIKPIASGRKMLAVNADPTTTLSPSASLGTYISPTENTHQGNNVVNPSVNEGTKSVESNVSDNSSSDEKKDKSSLDEMIAELERLKAENEAPVSLPYTARSKNDGFSIGLGGKAGSSNMKKGIERGSNLSSPFAANNRNTRASSFAQPVALGDIKSQQELDLDHKQPISFGITVSKQLNAKLSVETGIVYTYLSSNIKSKADADIQIKGTQSFYYLGIPLSLNYNLATLGKAKIYVSAGVMAQKDVYGKMKEDSSIRDLNNTESRNGGKIDQSNIQMSTMANVGASYPIYDKLHIYGSVGGAYYFDANNEYRTIYSDRKTQVDMNVGLKFEF